MMVKLSQGEVPFSCQCWAAHAKVFSPHRQTPFTWRMHASCEETLTLERTPYVCCVWLHVSTRKWKGHQQHNIDERTNGLVQETKTIQAFLIHRGIFALRTLSRSSAVAQDLCERASAQWRDRGWIIGISSFVSTTMQPKEESIQKDLDPSANWMEVWRIRWNLIGVQHTVSLYQLIVFRGGIRCWVQPHCVLQMDLVCFPLPSFLKLCREQEAFCVEKIFFTGCDA